MQIVLTGHRVKARPVVPIRVRRRVVRVDVARTIVGTIVQVAPTAHSTHDVGINEVGMRSQRPPRKCTAIPNLWMIIAGCFYSRLKLEDYSVFRMSFLQGDGGDCGPLCRLRVIHPFWVK